MSSQPQPLTSFAIATPPPPPGVPINLDLEIGVFACASEGVLKRNIHEKRECSFTAAQIHELCYQIFICNSIAHGFPLPFHPIYPTLRSIKGEKCDHSSVMDSEPGRCRRTDGRKWRCTKNVIPLQKYCQRHMHRGSRKHVEPIRTTDYQASDDSRLPVASLVASDIDTRVSTSCRTGFPLILKCRNDETRSVMLAGSGISVDYGRSVFSSSRDDCFKSSFDGNPMSLSSRKQNFLNVGFDSSRYGLSPKSVLSAAGKVGLGSGHTSSTMEPEPQRCRRTDGKKWQCRREALHSQKYCEAHMHRGAKRVVVKPTHSSHLQSPPTIDRNLESGINLNTVPECACSRRETSNNSCGSTSDSDATTITD